MPWFTCSVSSCWPLAILRRCGWITYLGFQTVMFFGGIQEVRTFGNCSLKALLISIPREWTIARRLGLSVARVDFRMTACLYRRHGGLVRFLLYAIIPKHLFSPCITRNSFSSRNAFNPFSTSAPIIVWRRQKHALNAPSAALWRRLFKYFSTSIFYTFPVFYFF